VAGLFPIGEFPFVYNWRACANCAPREFGTNKTVRFLILSDIHGNWEALQAVLADCALEYDQAICCGDLVGYNPNPSEVVEWARNNCKCVIRGNHDKVIAGMEGIQWFNEIAQASVVWSRHQLSAVQLKWLQDLPMGPQHLEHFSIFHGAPFDEDQYILAPEAAAECFTCLDSPLSFFGHTHVQGGFFLRWRNIGRLPGAAAARRDATFEIIPDTVYMVNPGSVGQPRDGDPRAGYAIYDSELRTVTMRRTEYPIRLTYQRIKEAGLPDVLGLRLFRGI
jgi:predicted phosphodiesterase